MNEWNTEVKLKKIYYFFKKGESETETINGATTVRSGTVEEESCKELFKECKKKL